MLPESRKSVEHKSDDDTNDKWFTRNDPKRLEKPAGILRRVLETWENLESLRNQWKTNS